MARFLWTGFEYKRANVRQSAFPRNDAQNRTSNSSNENSVHDALTEENSMLRNALAARAEQDSKTGFNFK